MDSTIRLWDVDCGVELARLEGHREGVNSVCFSPDGQRLASGAGDDTIRLWDVVGGVELARLEEDLFSVLSVCFSPNGQHLASGTRDNKIFLWNVDNNVMLARLKLNGLKNEVNCVCFSPDGQCLASASEDDTIRLWDVVGGVELARLEGHNYSEYGVWSVAFSPDGARLASVAHDGNLIIWDMTGLVQPLAKPQVPAGPLTQWLTRQAASLGRRAALPVADALDYWAPTNLESDDVEGCLGVLRPEEPDSGQCAVALSPDGRRLYAGHRNGEVVAWDLQSGEVIWQAKTNTSREPDVALTPDGCRLATTGSIDNTIRLWDVASGVEQARLEGHAGDVCSVCFSPDGVLLASGSTDNTIRLWDVAGGVEQARLEGHTELVYSVSFSPDGRRLASGSDDNTIRLWDVAGGVEQARLEGHTSSVGGVCFSPDGHRLASGSADKTIRLWDVASGVEQARLGGHTEMVRPVCFSPNGRRLASGDWGVRSTIRIWDVATGTELQRFNFPENLCWRLAWSRSGAFLVSGNKGDIIRIWDTRTPEMLRAHSHPPFAVSSAENQGKPKTPSPELALLPPAWTALHRLNIGLPLSLLQDLRALLGAETPEGFAEFAAHPGIRRLTALRWPTPARTGLIALLLHGWDGGEQWRPPPGTDTRALSEALTDALSGEPCDPDAPAPPLGFLTQAAETVDDRMVTLLTALGPKAVAADPGLPLRLRGEAARLPALTQPQRRLLSLRVIPLDAGAAQGTGVGIDRSGFARSGPVTALIPSQLALPDDLLLWRYLNGGLLYRARSGQEPPQLRPVIIVLDTSPAALGPIGGLTRPAALALSAALGRKRVPSVFLSAGDEKVFLLERPADRLRLLTHRHRNLGHPLATLRRAEALLDGLRDGRPVEPIILLLTHSHWGAETEDAPAFRRLRALFVHYPGSSPRPPWADRCERWEALRHTDAERVPAALGRLIG